MKITEVAVMPADGPDERLLAFAAVTFDESFVVNDLRVIRHDDGGIFVAMPSRHATQRCRVCDAKIQVRSRFCSNCGIDSPVTDHAQSPSRPFADIAHPINAKMREYIEHAVFQALAKVTASRTRPVSDA